jgi:hypothetical protein
MALSASGGRLEINQVFQVFQVSVLTLNEIQIESFGWAAIIP